MLRNDERGSARGAVIAGLAVLVAAATGLAAAPLPEPTEVESVQGSGGEPIVLDASEVKRLGVQTTPVREENVTRQMTVVAEIEDEPVAKPAAMSDSSSISAPTTTSEPSPSVKDSQSSDASPIRVRVLVDNNPDDDADDDAGQYDDEDDAEIVAPFDVDEAEPLRAKRVEMPPGAETEPNTLYFKIRSGTERGLAPGQRVGVKFAAPGSDTPKKIVPYSAVIYGASGDAWVYTSPEPAVFVRRQVTIEDIDDGTAVLSDGPPVGTQVVTVGAAELYGVELHAKH